MKRNTARQGVAAGFAYGMPDFPVSPARAARCGSIAAGEQAGDFLMIDKPIEKIEFSDLEKLLENSVAESRTIEYKRELPGVLDSDKKEFLADVSAFANTLGGDLLYGISEKGGVPASIGGVKIADADAEKQKYESMIADGIEPKIRVDLRTIEVEEGKAVLLIRVAKSWLSPHRVIYKGHGRFFARNSSGKYSLDTQQLRDAFNLSQTAVERMKEFRAGRIFEISAGRIPYVGDDLKTFVGGKAVLHFIPFVSLTPAFSVDLKSMQGKKHGDPLYITANNFDGVAGRGAGRLPSYVQIFRNGIVESTCSFFSRDPEDASTIPGILFAKVLRGLFANSLEIAKFHNIAPPAFVCLTLVEVKDYKLAPSWPLTDLVAIDRDVLPIPETVIESYDIKPAKVLLPLCNILWNACGFAELEYDEKKALE
ncbi:MAG: ATP-binding protein [Arenicellales bacterium IbO2]|nr:ATP-binding protein [Gammaproteobacteria bacterium]CAJ2376378.1 MAG: ATP-binding protein [Arenicellales bacterium IbO2]